MMIQLYQLMLRYYPARFRQNFSAEMQEVFADGLVDAANNGLVAVLIFFLRELIHFPSCVLREYLHERTRQSSSPVVGQDRFIARWIMRIAGLIISGFLLFITFVGNPAAPQSIGMAILFLSLMVTWRWEKTGGLLVICAAVITMLLNTIAMPGFMLTGLAFIGSGLLALPFLLFGWFFYYIGSLEQGYAQ